MNTQHIITLVNKLNKIDEKTFNSIKIHIEKLDHDELINFLCECTRMPFQTLAVNTLRRLEKDQSPND